MSLLAALTTGAHGGGNEPALPPDEFTKYQAPPAPTSYPWTPITTFLAPGAEGYPDGRVHPTVVDTGYAGWNGYRYWMADTPYPPDTYEDPHIWASNDRLNWVEPAPGLNPLMRNRRTPEYPDLCNADTEMVFDPDTGTMYCLWLNGGPSNPPWRGAYLAKSTDGKVWSVSGPLPMDPDWSGVSPSITYLGPGRWVMYVMAPYGRRFATAPEGPWSAPEPVRYEGPGTMRHGDVIYHDGLWWAIGAAPNNIVSCFISRDGINFRGSRGVIIGDWVTGGYRPTITPSNVPGYMDVWCSVMGGKEAYTSTYTRIPLTWWTSLLQ